MYFATIKSVSNKKDLSIFQEYKLMILSWGHKQQNADSWLDKA